MSNSTLKILAALMVAITVAGATQPVFAGSIHPISRPPTMGHLLQSISILVFQTSGSFCFHKLLLWGSTRNNGPSRKIPAW